MTGGAMPRYLIIQSGVVKDIIDKPLPLLGRDIDGQFDSVLIDASKAYLVGQALVMSDFIDRQDGNYVLHTNTLVDLERYKS